MTKTRKPVSLLIHRSLEGLVMEKLREQGHIVQSYCAEPIPSPWDFDLILGPNCWWMPKEHIDLLPTALKAAQETRYPKPEYDVTGYPKKTRKKTTKEEPIIGWDLPEKDDRGEDQPKPTKRKKAK